jgi:hypothetical protein
MISSTIGRFLRRIAVVAPQPCRTQDPVFRLSSPFSVGTSQNTAASRALGTLNVDDSHDLYRAVAKSVVR